MHCEVSDSSDIILESRQIGKSFPSSEGPISVLQEVDFILRRGESVSIRGESGSGKSTLLNVLSGLETLDSGELFWQGTNVSRQSLSTLAARRIRYIGFVFQAYYLVPELNALENVLMATRIAGNVNRTVIARAKSLLKSVGMEHRMEHSAIKLSGGERQRVAVARALINNPAVILADEPTGNLDEATGASVMELLLELVKEDEKSLILVTHNPEFAQKTERQLTLHLGKLSND
jgi:lipoprotein-releasing system ATP-binding protein